MEVSDVPETMTCDEVAVAIETGTLPGDVTGVCCVDGDWVDPIGWVIDLVRSGQWRANLHTGLTFRWDSTGRNSWADQAASEAAGN